LTAAAIPPGNATSDASSTTTAGEQTVNHDSGQERLARAPVRIRRCNDRYRYIVAAILSHVRVKFAIKAVSDVAKAAIALSR
jgi:hypothetical protein